MKKTRIIEPLTGILMLLIFWLVLSIIINNPVLPSPFVVLPLFIKLITGELGFHFLASTARILIAVFVSIITAVPAGLLLGQSKFLNRIFSPIINIVYPIPKIVLLPVIYVLAGITDFSKILLICFILFFQIIVVVRDNAASLPEELILSVKSLGAGRIGLFFFVYFPASIPVMLTALRVSIGTSIAVLFIAEQSLTEYGLGYYIIVKAYQILRYEEMYAGILAISILGLLLYFLIDLLQKHLVKYKS